MNWILIIIQNQHSAGFEKKMKSLPFSKTRWKRENLFKNLRHEIDKETQSVSDKTGMNPWIILGTKSVEYFWKFSDLHFIFTLNPHLYSKHLGRILRNFHLRADCIVGTGDLLYLQVLQEKKDKR